MRPSIRILLIDDHAMMREGLSSMLNLSPGLHVIAETGDARDAVRLFREHQPDVTLLDISMPQLDGISCLGRLRGEFPEARIIMLTSSDLEQDIVLTFQAGASGYVLKTASSEELVDAIRRVHSGDIVMAADIGRWLTVGCDREQLTPREVEVLNLLRKGFTNPEIASFLNIVPRTAQAHVISIIRKLEAADRTDAVVRAFEMGILKVS